MEQSKDEPQQVATPNDKGRRSSDDITRMFLVMFVGGIFAITLSVLALAPVLGGLEPAESEKLGGHFKDVAAVVSGLLGLMFGHYFTKK
jgi:hypothetical protein